MKKQLFVIFIVLLLASCAPQTQKASGSPTISTPDVSNTLVAPLSSPSPSLSSEPFFKTSHEGERVSDFFYTGDLEQFFQYTPKELFAQLDFHTSEEYLNTFICMDITFMYTGYISTQEESESTLNRIVLSSFNFRGLNESSNFEDLINTLGDTELFFLHHDGGFDFAAEYTIDDFHFVFYSPEENGDADLKLAIMPVSQVFFQSGGQGESVSKTLTTADIEQFLKYEPEDIRDILGNGEAGCDEDTGSFNYYFDYIGIHFSYCYTEAQKGEDIIVYPALPLQYVWLDDFEFRGLNQGSTFEDIMEVLGRKKVKEIPIVDTYYFALQYKIDGMLFEFSGWDEQASEGVTLSIKSLNQ